MVPAAAVRPVVQFRAMDCTYCRRRDLALRQRWSLSQQPAWRTLPNQLWLAQQLLLRLRSCLTISPANAPVPSAGTQPFTASLTGTSNTAVSWSLSGPGCGGSSCGTISTSASFAVYLAPTVPPSPASVNVIATSVAEPTKSASANVTVVPVVGVTVSPTGASLPTGMTQQFNVSVTGTSNTSVAWNVAGAGCSSVACGTINSSGLYTAPAMVPSPATVTITATSVTNQTKWVPSI